MASWIVRFVTWDSGPYPGRYPVFDVLAGSQLVFRLSLSLGDEKAIVMRARLGDTVMDHAGAADQALLRLNLRRIEEELRTRAGAPEEATESRVNLYITEEQLTRLISSLREKHCRYQHEQDGDLYCRVAHENDPTATVRSGLRLIAPTTHLLCSACDLPDTDLVCSHLMHPAVMALVGDGTIMERTVAGALCDRGRGEIAQPTKCGPAGHPCWERRIMIDETVHEPLGPLALHRAVDQVDLAWKATLGHADRLFVARGQQVPAGLAQEANGRAELGQRLDELDTLFRSIRLPDHPSRKLEHGKDRPLLRLREYLAVSLDDAAGDPVTRHTLDAAVGRLRRIVDVRRALSHVGETEVRPDEAFGHLGIDYPPDDWSVAWRVIREAAAGALFDISRVIQALEP